MTLTPKLKLKNMNLKPQQQTREIIEGKYWYLLQRNLYDMNTFFNKKANRKSTWVSSNEKTRN